MKARASRSIASNTPVSVACVAVEKEAVQSVSCLTELPFWMAGRGAALGGPATTIVVESDCSQVQNFRGGAPFLVDGYETSRRALPDSVSVSMRRPGASPSSFLVGKGFFLDLSSPRISVFSSSKIG